jgi:phytanoyl-CoA hydroxylase
VPKSLHQDEYYFEHQHHSTVGVLSYATDVDMDNSPLYVVPGSHKLGTIEHIDDQWAGFALPDESWWDKAVPVTGKAGDAILFHGLTVHGSPANRSDRPRPVFIQRYRRADDFCTIDVGNSQDRRQAERSPATHKSPDDWGLMVRGLRRVSSTS